MIAESPSSAAATAIDCAACGGHRFRLRYQLGLHCIVQCESCGLGTALPKPTPTALKQLYADPGYFQDGSYYLDYLGHAAGYRRLARKVVARVVQALAPPGRWFDVGAAAGFFMQEAKAAGFSVAGIEPCNAMAEYAQSTGLDVQSALFEEVSLADASQSVVAFLDSLEHLLSPRAALERARLALTPGGVVVIHTPNMGSLAARVMRQHWPHFTPPEHLHYFDRTSLRLLLERTGFSVLSLTSLGHYFSVRELSRRLLHMNAGDSTLARKTLYVDSGDLFAIARTE